VLFFFSMGHVPEINDDDDDDDDDCSSRRLRKKTINCEENRRKCCLRMRLCLFFLVSFAASCVL